MKSIAIMQPTFLPWSGYFDLIDQVDEFVFLENVQFEKQSWQQRNRVLSSDGLEWITVPVLRKGRFGQNICDVEINKVAFPAKQIRKIEQHYARAPFFDHYWPEIKKIFLSIDYASLAVLNVNLIRLLSQQLTINGNFKISSQLQPSGTRSERLVEIIKKLGASRYLSPIGSAVYLQNDHELFSRANIEILFQNYEPRPYKQLNSGFTPGASVLDILFNEGINTTLLIREGRGSLIPFNDFFNEQKNNI